MQKCFKNNPKSKMFLIPGILDKAPINLHIFPFQKTTSIR